MDKVDLNKHRQTKEYFTAPIDDEYNANYIYLKKDDVEFKNQVLKLRNKFSNDAEFGKAVAKILNNNNNFPGVQNL